MQNFVRLFSAAAVSLVSAGAASALTLGTDFAPHYATTDLGSIAGVPANYGGLTLKAGSPNTLLIGGAASLVPVTIPPADRVALFGTVGEVGAFVFLAGVAGLVLTIVLRPLLRRIRGRA